MAYDLSQFKTKVSGVGDWLKSNLSTIRTGRATITLLDNVMIDSYGTKTRLNQTANVTIEDPKTIRIVPWDKSVLTAIEKGISLADLGVSTSVDGEGVRVIFPSLTTETREKLVKQAKNKIEEAKVSLRNERNKIVKDIDDAKKNDGMPEDDAKRSKEDVDRLIREAQASFEELLAQKEEEILN